MSKTPFSLELFKEAALEVHAALDALAGQSRKLLLLDLDDTLWGGIVGDVGWQNLRLGGHDAVGEAFRDFQRALKSLQTRGILLGIVSKNEETTALEAIRSHPEMVLRLEDFIGWRINWDDKARNIADLARELNLGLQSVVFIDDNPVERDRVRSALPEVLVPEWPPTPLESKASLQRLRCFDQPQISSEDRRRSEMYRVEKKRREIFSEATSLQDWLRSLEIRVVAEPVNPANLERVSQLFNKTNQMNLSTRRLAKNELWDWAGRPGNTMLAFRVSDKLGDSGLVGLASLGGDDVAGQARLVDFILSCRVMGRKVEETMLHLVSVRARAAGAVRLRATYLPTPKNQPCLRFFQTNGFELEQENVFVLDISREACQKPAGIDLQWAGTELKDA
jgi:FkbH-like protein